MHDEAVRRARPLTPGRRIVAGIGRTFIGAGVIILLFVAFQLWGTNLTEARNQDALRKQFDASIRVQDGGARPDPTGSSTTTTVAPAPPPEDGEAVAHIVIPKIGVDKMVVEGVGVPDLKKGPGHYPRSPMPGQPGNAAIAGHRTTYGAPFSRLDELVAGDPIQVATRQGQFVYRVTETRIVKPSETEVLDPTDDSRLTLTTCHPRFSAAQRMIVIAALEGPAVEAPPVLEQPDDPEPVSFEDDAGLSGDPSARGPAIGWGVLAAIIALAFWTLGRLWRRWPAYLLGAPVFLVVLFVFFENVSRLLPANI